MVNLLNNSYKLLVVDVDGTLVDRDGNISLEDREALVNVRRAGVEVALSTGRAARACLGIIDQLALDGYHIFFDGALISNPGEGKELYVRPVDSPAIIEMIEFAHLNDIYLELFSSTSFFVERETWAAEIRRRFFGIEPTLVDFTDIWKRERIIKAQLVTLSPQEVDRARSFYEHFNGRLHFSWAKTPAYPDVDFINVLAPEVSKGRALEALASYFGIAMSEIVAIGDGVNDIPFLSVAGLAVAMQNAPGKVREVADYVTGDVDHSGLAAAVKKFLL